MADERSLKHTLRGAPRMTHAQTREAKRIGQQNQIDRAILPTNAELNRESRELRAENIRRTRAAPLIWR